MFYGQFCAHVRLNATSRGNEAKSKMKDPSDMSHRDSNSGGSDLWSNALLTRLGTFYAHSVLQPVDANTKSCLIIGIFASRLCLAFSSYKSCVYI